MAFKRINRNFARFQFHDFEIAEFGFAKIHFSGLSGESRRILVKKLKMIFEGIAITVFYAGAEIAETGAAEFFAGGIFFFLFFGVFVIIPTGVVFLHMFEAKPIIVFQAAVFGCAVFSGFIAARKIAAMHLAFVLRGKIFSLPLFLTHHPTFSAQIYVASLVAIGMTRIMGAIMVGIIMAGRTGASYAATIGTMQVNEEIDALKTMGIPVADFLVLPRIMALTIATPFLVILADFMGIIGGAAVGVLILDIPAPEYYKYTLNALDMTNFLVGLFHGLVFGIVISLCGCYFGIYCGRNADSVGKATTQAVVSAIVWMIVVTGIITVIFEALGI